MDQGSTHTFCDKTLIQSLGITGRSEKICLQTLAGSVKGYDRISCELEVSGLDGEMYYTIPNVFSINEIPVRPNLVLTQRKILELPHLKGIKLDTLSNVEVGLLIGVDVPDLFCTSEFRKGPRGTPSAIYTPLGWSLLGPSLSPSYSTNCKVHFSRKTDDAAYQFIESLWDSEFVKGTTVLDTPNSKEDRAAFHLMQDSVTIHKGHYQLPLLWRHSQVSLPNNYAIAKHRLAALKHRFLSDPHLKAKYLDVINGYLEKGYARKLTSQELSVNVATKWYLPHHPVVNPNKPNKVRVVFDCAARYSNVSLNDNLM